MMTRLTPTMSFPAAMTFTDRELSKAELDRFRDEMIPCIREEIRAGTS